MKHVFSSHSELAHVWANLSRAECTEGRNGRASNCSFSGEAFVSWGTVIARHYWHAGRRCVVINSRAYSSSTRKHHSHVRRALSDSNGPRFEQPVPGGYGQQWEPDPRVIHAGCVASALDSYSKSTHARVNRVWLFNAAVETLAKANEATAFFGLRFKPFALATEAQQLDTLLSLGAQIKRQTDAQRRKEEKAQRAREELARVRAELRAKVLAHFAPQALANWRAHVSTDTVNGSRPQRSASEQLGQHISEGDLLDFAVSGQDRRGVLGQGRPAALRLSEDGSRVETSRSAQVLVRTVRFLWAFCATAKATQTPVPADTLARFPRLTHYTCDEIDAQGNVRAGCHFIAFVEIEGIARQLGLPPFNGQPAEAPAIPAASEEVTA